MDRQRLGDGEVAGGGEAAYRGAALLEGTAVAAMNQAVAVAARRPPSPARAAFGRRGYALRAGALDRFHRAILETRAGFFAVDIQPAHFSGKGLWRFEKVRAAVCG